MLSPEDRYQLLETASELSERWDPQGVDELLAPLTLEDLLADSELGHIQALALYRMGRLREAMELVGHMADACQQHSVNLYCRHLLLRGALLVDRGDLDGGERLFAEAGSISESNGDQNQLALARMNTGVISLIRCDWLSGLASFSRAEAAYARLGQTMDMAYCAHNRGMAYREMGRFAVAADSYDSAIGHYLDNGNFRHLASTETERALLYREIKDLKLAEAAATRAMKVAVFYNNLRQEAEAFRVLGMVKFDRGLREEARVCYERGLTLAQHTNAAMLEAEVVEELAMLAKVQGEIDVCGLRMERAAEIYMKLGATRRAERLYHRLTHDISG